MNGSQCRYGQKCNRYDTTIPLCMVATVTHHTGLVALLICNLVTHQAGLVANCHTLFQWLLYNIWKNCGPVGYNIRNYLIWIILAPWLLTLQMWQPSHSRAGCYHTERDSIYLDYYWMRTTAGKNCAAACGKWWNKGVCTKFLTLCIKFLNPQIWANPPHPPRHTVILG